MTYITNSTRQSNIDTVTAIPKFLDSVRDFKNSHDYIYRGIIPRFANTLISHLSALRDLPSKALRVLQLIFEFNVRPSEKREVYLYINPNVESSNIFYIR